MVTVAPPIRGVTVLKNRDRSSIGRGGGGGGRGKEKPEEKKRNQALKCFESSRVERMPSEMTIEVKSAAAAAS